MCLTLSISGVTGKGVPLPMFSLYNTCAIRKHPEKQPWVTFHFLGRFKDEEKTQSSKEPEVICWQNATDYFSGSCCWDRESAPSREAGTSAAEEGLSELSMLFFFIFVSTVPPKQSHEDLRLFVRTRCCYPHKWKHSLFLKHVCKYQMK